MTTNQDPQWLAEIRDCAAYDITDDDLKTLLAYIDQLREAVEDNLVNHCDCFGSGKIRVSAGYDYCPTATVEVNCPYCEEIQAVLAFKPEGV